MPQVFAYAIDNLYVKNGILAPLISITMIQHSIIIHTPKGAVEMEES